MYVYSIVRRNLLILWMKSNCAFVSNMYVLRNGKVRMRVISCRGVTYALSAGAADAASRRLAQTDGRTASIVESTVPTLDYCRLTIRLCVHFTSVTQLTDLLFSTPINSYYRT